MLIESPHKNVKWNVMPAARPYTTTSGFAFGPDGRFPILWRSDKVRSAKNCWSIPSGLHEIGFTMEQQFHNELLEECNLIGTPGTSQELWTYENIAAFEGWHWVIHVLAYQVQSLEPFKNSEPDKHTKFEFITVDDLRSISPWAPGLGESIEANFGKVKAFANILNLVAAVKQTPVADQTGPTLPH